MNVLFACAACYGQSDSAMAVGLNWGILSLLLVVLPVLGSIAAFFIYVARRSAAMSASGTAAFSEVHVSRFTFHANPETTAPVAKHD
jgi:hypothetical protein